MPIIPNRLQFATQSYRMDARPISAQRCVNMYAEAQPKSAKTDVAVFGSPGIVSFATCGVGPVRGMHFYNDLMYVVSGAFLYSMDEDGAVVQLGGQISGTGVVEMDDNGTELVIVNGANGYIYDANSGFRLITDTDFNAAKTVTYINSYFLFDQTGTNKVFRSDSDDGTSYDQTAFASAESQSDNVSAVLNLGEIVHVFGEKSLEFWGYTAAANFPFQRIPNSSRRRGIISSYAKAIEDDAIHYVSDDKIAYRLIGTRPTRISTHAIEKEWESYATLDDCFAVAYTFGGHKFVAFTFPAENKTFEFDISTQLWHERASHDRTGRALGRWRANCACSAWGRTFIGDGFSGAVGYLSGSTYTEFGNTMQGEVVSPPVYADGKMLSMPSFELDIETGVGLTSGQGSDPQIMLSVSDDGGYTFEEPEMWTSMGARGDYGKAYVSWDRLGSFYQRCIKVRVSDPVPRTIIAARAPGLSIGI